MEVVVALLSVAPAGAGSDDGRCGAVQARAGVVNVSVGAR